MSANSKYQLTVGIETHVQLKTKSKLFSGADNLTLDAEPNTLVNHIDFGLPGALPVLNKQAIVLAAKAAFAFNTKPQPFSKFDRKHYFYPDLPMGYQISQYDEPIILGGYVEFWHESELKKINLTRAHLEADAGKSLHPENADYSLVDLNRAGTPLLEIVSEPELHSASEAKAYAQELYLLMRYADVSDANLFYGNMRFDVNVSVSTDNHLGTRTESKNLNSFKALERAIIYETKRQIELLEKGQSITQETRGWDDTKGKGYSLRTKENADEYRYMPDPDLPPVELNRAFISEVEATMPKLPNFWRQALTKYQLDPSIVQSLIEWQVDSPFKHLQFLVSLDPAKAKVIANWLVNTEAPLLKDDVSLASLSEQQAHELYSQLYELYSSNKLSSTNLKLLLSDLLLAKTLPDNLEAYAQAKGLIQTSDLASLTDSVEQVLAVNPKAVADIKAGEAKAVGFLVGQIMRATKGQANPEMVKKLINQKLEL